MHTNSIFILLFNFFIEDTSYEYCIHFYSCHAVLGESECFISVIYICLFAFILLIISSCSLVFATSTGFKSVMISTVIHSVPEMETSISGVSFNKWLALLSLFSHEVHSRPQVFILQKVTKCSLELKLILQLPFALFSVNEWI